MRNITIQWKNISISLFLFFLLGISETGVVISDPASGEDTVRQDVWQASNRGQGPITIIPGTSFIMLDTNLPPDVELDGEVNPLLGYSSFNVTVQSILPTWGAQIDVFSLEGPNGNLPHDRLWVRTSETDGKFTPMDQPVPIVTGDYRLPVREVPVEILFRPTWQDMEGDHSFQLVLSPATFDLLRPNNLMTSDTKVETLEISEIEADIRIPGGFKNLRMISLSLSSSEITFKAGIGPGIYQANEDITFWVSTNADRWHIDCQASELTSKEHELPLEQLYWERLDEFGNVVDSGNLATPQTILTGYEPVTDLETVLRFKIEITPYDIAGVYKGEISLLGLVD